VTRLLQGQLRLHDVDDVEALAGKALDDAISGFGGKRRPDNGHYLSTPDREDAIAYLITTCWHLAARYNPDRGWSFSKYAYRTLRLRTVDWYRQRYGDSRWHTQEQRQHLSLDNPDPVHDTDADPRTRRNRLDEALGTWNLDPATHSNPDLERALLRPSSRPTDLNHPKSQRAPRRAA
jgi:hypothetical protein